MQRSKSKYEIRGGPSWNHDGEPRKGEVGRSADQVITLLGIELDTVAKKYAFPGRSCRLRTEFNRWSGKKACTKKELISLIGQLQHTCGVVRPGHTFLRSIIALWGNPKELHHKVRLND